MKYKFNEFFKSIEFPSSMCVNCFCNYCVNNVEGKINEKEYANLTEEELCFNCDICRQYTGNPIHKLENKTLCENFNISNYGIETNKKRLIEWNKSKKRKKYNIIEDLEQYIQRIAYYYGLDNQIDKTIEECTELIQALSKCKEKEISEQEKVERRKHAIEELADVKIMTEQMIKLFDCKEEVVREMKYKINRQLERIKKEKEQ